MNARQKIELTTAAILLLCFIPLPYGFYTIVRIITTIVSIYLALGYYSVGKKNLAIAFGVIALLFQPIIKIALGREIWLIVDLIVAVLLLLLALKRD